MFKLRTLQKARAEEKGAALLFAVMASLIGMALAFILMATTTQNLNVAFFSVKDLRLDSENKTAVATAIELINSGYDYSVHDEANPYIITKTITVNSTVETVSRTEWWVDKIDLINTNKCVRNPQNYIPGTIEYLIVGGGGSGGNNIGAGGGAGGFIEGETILAAGEYTVLVGSGGASVSGYQKGENGQDSSFLTFTASGGGAGGAVSETGELILPQSGGSGGGATKPSGYNTATNGGLGTPGQGNNGGETAETSLASPAGSGGGGANISGSAASNGVGGAGGNGLSSNISGFSVFYAAGGGGSAPTGGTSGAGGSGGGGSGGIGQTQGADGIPNTGSGGGGGYDGVNSMSGSGASGTVIIRYPIEIDGVQIEAIATGGTITDETVDNIQYRVHSFNDTGEGTFNFISTGESNHLCGLNIIATTTMPYYSDEDILKTSTILTPMHYNSASINSNIIQYAPDGVSLFRHGIYANNNISLNGTTKLYSYYYNDILNGAMPVLTPSLSLGIATLAAGNSVEVTSLDTTAADIQSVTLGIKETINEISSYATCLINDLPCSNKLSNKQNHQIIFDDHNSWIEDTCQNNYVESFGLMEPLESGITCVQSNVSLSKNTVMGEYYNPSILIVDGDVTIVSGAELNMDRTPRLLQIYATGDIEIVAQEGSESSIYGLLAATGPESSITITSTASNSSVNIYGNMVSNNITTDGNVTIWQELSSKFIKNGNKIIYQKISEKPIEYKQKPFNLSGMGRVFGEKINPESLESENINTQTSGAVN
jgi:hypothetical protein